MHNINETYLGIELGSTRIKAVLIDNSHQPIASGSHAWENRLENGVWTYSLDDAWTGLRACFASLLQDVQTKYGVQLTTVGAIGISGMMHGYLAFNAAGNQLAPFRTWRNTITGEASRKLTELFGFKIPQRWSIAHLYQAILNGESHVAEINCLTTLAGYIHWQLTGEKQIGIGEASGMFPIDTAAKQYDARMADAFDELVAGRNYPWKLRDILPAMRVAGDTAGRLTEAGAKLLDPSGTLQPGIPFCPPEGDGDTGMVATNSVAPRTGNVSAGTSVFAMAVLEAPIKRVYEEIDIFATPAGDPVAEAHCNNCTGDLDAWVGLFGEALAAFDAKPNMDTLYGTLYRKALEGDEDCGGLLAYNYLSGEHITGFTEGRPLFVRTANSRFNLSNFMRVHLFTALGALRKGMDVLLHQEKVSLSSITGHGGFFKVEGVGQRVMAAALGAPVTVMVTAGEGGPWGMAILAAFSQNRKDGETLADYLNNSVFRNSAGTAIAPDPADTAGFAKFMDRYSTGLAIEAAAVESLRE
jgi:sugar (pentulose or hexulose) kinase